MITILGLWETVWMGPRTERRVWQQTMYSFKVDRWAMTALKDAQTAPWTYPVPFEDVGEMLAAYPGKKTFLMCPDRMESQDLIEYEHPEDAIYVFGNNAQNLVKFVSDEDDVVTINTPWDGTLFAHCAAPIVLYDRMLKCQRTTGQ